MRQSPATIARFTTNLVVFSVDGRSRHPRNRRRPYARLKLLRFRRLFHCLFAACLGLAASTAANAQDNLVVRPLALDPDDPLRDRVGRLQWRGGLEILYQNERFGGLSGLHIASDGASLTAVSDRGTWFSARLHYRHGMLVGLTDPAISPLIRPNGKHVTGSLRDAEALTPDGRGGFLVAFERRHRIWRYPSRRPSPLTGPPNRMSGTKSVLRDQPRNGGVESLTRLCDGRLLAISEEKRLESGALRGWLRRSGVWSPLVYETVEEFHPTDAATLPDCRIVILERSFNFIDGPEARLVILEPASIRSGATLNGRELAQLAPPLTVDNMEGLSARRGAAGEILLYLVSDDNFSGLQRTILLMFALRADAPKP
jgi:hypothetical protein